MASSSEAGTGKAGPLTRKGADVLLLVRLTPRADRSVIEGVKTLADGHSVLSVRVREVPESGRANAALESLVADVIGVPKSSVAVVQGGTARLKTLRLSNLSPDDEVRAAAALGLSPP